MCEKYDLAPARGLTDQNVVQLTTRSDDVTQADHSSIIQSDDTDSVSHPPTPSYYPWNRFEFRDVKIPHTQHELQHLDARLEAALDILHEIDDELNDKYITVHVDVAYGGGGPRTLFHEKGIYHAAGPSRNSADELDFLKKFTRDYSQLMLTPPEQALPWTTGITLSQRSIEGFDVTDYTETAVQTIMRTLEEKTHTSGSYDITWTGRRILTPGEKWDRYNHQGVLSILLQVARTGEELLSVSYRRPTEIAQWSHRGHDIKQLLDELCEDKVRAWFNSSVDGVTVSVPVGGTDNTLLEANIAANPHYEVIARRLIEPRSSDDFKKFVPANYELTVLALDRLLPYDCIKLDLPADTQIQQDVLEDVMRKYRVNIRIKVSESKMMLLKKGQ